ncbi:hypothetical protein XENOCAPTIV_016393 [Xenoophorus captivus]|uniref:Uncharacterized protein n=1 Tax=Xenoophorus captivus TaxID=1517983 RepID=A0ABV0R1T0_9TELE
MSLFGYLIHCPASRLLPKVRIILPQSLVVSKTPMLACSTIASCCFSPMESPKNTHAVLLNACIMLLQSPESPKITFFGLQSSSLESPKNTQSSSLICSGLIITYFYTFHFSVFIVHF